MAASREGNNTALEGLQVRVTTLGSQVSENNPAAEVSYPSPGAML